MFKIKERTDNLRFKIYYNSLFKIKVWTTRKVVKLFKLGRHTSYPFITGDSFRALAQHIFDESSDIDCPSVMHSDIVFVRTDFLHTFFKKIHIKIINPYILISHNADNNIDSQYEKYIDDKIIHWFAQNLLIDNKKITPIPIGITLRFYDKKNTTAELIKKYRNKIGRILKIFFGFYGNTNKKRLGIVNDLRKCSVCVECKDFLEKDKYYDQVSNYVFNASPIGNGIDCIRTWESLYLGTIPVVERSVSTGYWKNIGIPLLLVDSWKDLENVREDWLKKEYEDIKNKIGSEAIYMDYWIKEVIKYKN
ncbi:MAG: hypothetical protein WCC74_00835 [Minisyncoccia bacterium]